MRTQCAVMLTVFSVPVVMWRISLLRCQSISFWMSCLFYKRSGKNAPCGISMANETNWKWKHESSRFVQCINTLGRIGFSASMFNEPPEWKTNGTQKKTLRRDTLQWMRRRRRQQQQNIVPKISHFKCQLRIIFAARCHKPWHDKLYFLYSFFIWKLLIVCWRRRHCCCLFIVPMKCFSYADERQKSKKKKKTERKSNIKIDRHQLALRCV